MANFTGKTSDSADFIGPAEFEACHPEQIPSNRSENEFNSVTHADHSLVDRRLGWAKDYMC
ncbi:MAG: hypothetical protein K2W81_02165 [Sphingomonas sp.]|uniref:hypothetical protein n=1 Tax=Sphingomonas sp. TaxID=28214 RepID=UPI0025FE67B6|nr:hypothetical protein [Sphingomonas sp.]MBY0282753.1 hypothetical protein [Sphingomonas sp.]